MAKHCTSPACEGCAMAAGKRDIQCMALESTDFGGKACPFRQTREEFLRGRIEAGERALKVCTVERLGKYYAPGQLERELADWKRQYRKAMKGRK